MLITEAPRALNSMFSELGLRPRVCGSKIYSGVGMGARKEVLPSPKKKMYRKMLLTCTGNGKVSCSLFSF